MATIRVQVTDDDGTVVCDYGSVAVTIAERCCEHLIDGDGKPLPDVLWQLKIDAEAMHPIDEAEPPKCGGEIMARDIEVY